MYKFFFLFISYFLVNTIGYADSNINILVFGDFGTGDKDQQTTAIAMKTYCDQVRCDFAVTVGDNIYPRGVENLYNGKVDYIKGSPNYEIIKKVFVGNYKKLNIPIYMSYGNHDVGNGGVVSVFKDLFRKDMDIKTRTSSLMSNQINFTGHEDNPVLNNEYGEKLWNFPEPYYRKNIETVSLFAIDTNTYPHRVLDDNNKNMDMSNPKNKKQGDWLDTELKDTPADNWKIVFGHMPLISHGHHGFKDAAAIKDFNKSIMNVLCENKVDFYLAGHDHHLEIDQLECNNKHKFIQILTGAAAKKDRIYQRSFPLFGRSNNLVWGNGKHYRGDKTIFKNNDEVLGFTHLSLNKNGNKAYIIMKLSSGEKKNERENGCFLVDNTEENSDGRIIKQVDCSEAEGRSSL